LRKIEAVEVKSVILTIEANNPFPPTRQPAHPTSVSGFASQVHLVDDVPFLIKAAQLVHGDPAQVHKLLLMLLRFLDLKDWTPCLSIQTPILSTPFVNQSGGFFMGETPVADRMPSPSLIDRLN